jgi:hypothetical protein
MNKEKVLNEKSVNVAELFEKAFNAQKNNRSLKSVFEELARSYNKKPNSIRNLYYLKVKEAGESRELGSILGANPVVKNSFISFKESEVKSLIKYILTEQGKGRSVRAITLELGNDTKRGMLRMQNKYRSTVLQRPSLVEEIMDELRRENINFFNPYSKIVFNKALSKDYKNIKLSYLPALIEIAESFERLKSISGKSFFQQLNALGKAVAEREKLAEELEALKAKLADRRNKV